MKYFLTVLCVFVTMAIFGPVSGAEKGSEPRECSLSDSSDMDLEDKLETCIFGSMKELKEEIGSANSTEEFRETIRNYCNNMPLDRQCATNLTLIAEGCMNETEFKSFKALRVFYQVVVDVACTHHGEPIGSILVGARRLLANNTERRAIVQECNTVAEVEVARIASEDPAPHPGMYQYNVMKYLKECIAERGQDVDSLVNDGVSLLNDVMIKMKCINSDVGTVILCRRLDKLKINMNAKETEV